MLAHVLQRLGDTPALSDPFPHFYLEGWFPDEVYQRMIEELPPPDLYGSMGPRHTLQSGVCTRFELVLTESNIENLSPRPREIWNSVRSVLTSTELKRAIFRKLSAGLARRFGIPPAAVNTVEGHPRLGLMRETAGYSIAPHPDTRKKVVTVQIALPRDHSQLNLGTALYRRSLAWQDLTQVPRGFRKVKQFPFAPNSGYAFAVLNQIGAKSWHGRELLGDDDGVRHSLLNIYYAKREHAGSYD
jgi:hypothetical protein